MVVEALQTDIQYFVLAHPISFDKPQSNVSGNMLNFVGVAVYPAAIGLQAGMSKFPETLVERASWNFYPGENDKCVC